MLNILIGIVIGILISIASIIGLWFLLDKSESVSIPFLKKPEPPVKRMAQVITKSSPKEAISNFLNHEVEGVQE